MAKNISVKVIKAGEGKAIKHMLPGKIFGQDVNEPLLRQAVRVYQFNQRQGTVKTKTRNEVRGSRRKIWRQKGTGRARHGDRYAPIFVGGGVAHGPQPRDWSRKLPKKMRSRALFSALTLKLKEDRIYIFDSLDKLEPKTREFARLFREKIGFSHEKEKLLIVVDEITDNLWRGIRNLQNVEITEAHLLNAYDVLYYDKLVITKHGVRNLEEHFLPKKDENN